MRSRRSAWLACAGCACVFIGASGCGGSSSPTHSTSTSRDAAAVAAGATRTQELCREKRAAIARLGNVHITYGGIARLGLPAVKELLNGYLGRLLAVLREFEHRGEQLATPPSVASTLRAARRLDTQSQEITEGLQSAVAQSQSANELAAAFRAWLVKVQQLATRSDALAQRLKLPGCRAQSGAKAAPTV